MSRKKVFHRITAMLLSAVMVVGMTPVSALAETDSFPIGASGEIIAFEALGANISMRSVPLATNEADLELPDSLTATIRLAASTEEPVLDSGGPYENSGSADTASGSAIGIEETEFEGSTGTEIASPSDAQEDGDYFESEPTEKTVDNVTEITLSLPVTWDSSLEYNGEAASTYIFTPELPKEFTLASSAEIPAITVTVGAVTMIGTVTAFEELPENVRWQNTSAPEFPETVDGTVAGKAAQIPVIWESEQDYDAESPQRGLYVFTAVLGEGYGLADDVELPRITVYIPQTSGGMMGRMAGGGTTDSPLEITTAAQLAEIALLVNARPNGLELFLFNKADAKVTLELQSDIDLSVYASGEGWIPIGTSSNYFKGTFDGGGHKISNLTINRAGGEYQGLFGYISVGGVVKNLGIQNVAISAKNYAGSVAGEVRGGTVQNCYTTGSVGGNIYVGGVLGVVFENSTVQNCYSTSIVDGTLDFFSFMIGGLVGGVYDSTVINCFVTGSVIGNSSSSSTYTGGLTGYLVGESMMQNCAALNPSVSGRSIVARVAGGWPSDSPVLSGNLAFDGMTVTKHGGMIIPPAEGADQMDGASKTAANIKATGFFEALFGNDAAWIYAAGKLPVLDGLSGQSDVLPAYITGLTGAGTSDDPYRIYTAADLKFMSDILKSGGDSSVRKYYRLENDIDLSVYGKNYDGGKGWMPISSFTNSEFDGNGKTITGLYINRSDVGNTGLFGKITASTVQNLFLEGISLHKNATLSGGHIGGLAGHVDGGSRIAGCAVRGLVTGEETPSSHGIGGLVGLLEQGSTLNNCVFYGTVSVKDDGVYGTSESPASVFAGGIVGCLSQYAAVKNCISVADVYATGENAYAGGIAGQVDSGAGIALSAALCAGVCADAAAGRIAGVITSSASGDPNNKNYAWNGMAVNDSTVESDTATSINGVDVDADAIQTLWTSGALKDWDADSWSLAQSKLPMLKGLPDQNEILPFYIVGLLGAGYSADDPFLIYTSHQLDVISFYIDVYKDKHFRLMADIDLSLFPNWTPIGNTLPFAGTFNGNGYCITNMNISRNGVVQGLFGWVTGAVTNLGIVDAHINGGDYVGGVVGLLTGGGTVQNCYVTGEISGESIIGGVVGLSDDGSTVKNCYSTAKVSGKKHTGGMIGSASGEVKNCVALNPSVSGSYDVGRVAGFINHASLLNNYAFSSIPGTWENKGPSAKDGADITSQTIFDRTFWTKAGNWHSSSWDSDVWTFEDDKLPTFKGRGGKGGEGGLHLTVRDIQYATVTPDTTSFTYNGSQQLPILTISFDGKTLEKDIDYIVSITSTDGSGTSGATNAGTVTLAVKGIGNFSGTQSLSYTIGNGESGDGGGSSTVPSAPSVPEKKPDQPVTATAPVTATTGTNGTASATIPEKAITDTIAKAQADARAQGKTANGISVGLNVTMPKGATSLTATLTQNSLNSLVNAGVSRFELDGAPISLDLDLNALKEIQKQSIGNISISIAPATGLSKEAKAILGNRPVYSVTISYVDKNGKTQTITSLGSGLATLSIPYTPGKNEAVDYLFGVYVDAKGKAQRISGSAYDANSGSLLIPTGHFSVYGIGYTAPSAKFTDIGTHWGKEAIDYVVGRGVLSGTSETTFAPDTTMTRGMLVTALGRLAGVDVKAYATNSFTDVKTDSVFRPYIEWAYKKGIVQGIGNQQFAPDRAITREEIAVIFANYAKATGYKLPVTRETTAYTDASGIGSVYQTAVTAMQQAGIMMGGTGNKFNPKSNATRAEVSSMLHRYIKLTIDPITAQGWALNDAGQWLYYKGGKALPGTQTIDGVKYFFETNGTLKTGWVKDGDNWHYYSGNKAAMSWLDISDKRYYFTKDGLMVSGKWLEIDGKWYYFYADGALAKNAKIDGYEVDKNGVRKTK